MAPPWPNGIWRWHPPPTASKIDPSIELRCPPISAHMRYQGCVDRPSTYSVSDRVAPPRPRGSGSRRYRPARCASDFLRFSAQQPSTHRKAPSIDAIVGIRVASPNDQPQSHRPCRHDRCSRTSKWLPRVERPEHSRPYRHICATGSAERGRPYRRLCATWWHPRLPRP
jgi:hypothetical protein